MTEKSRAGDDVAGGKAKLDLGKAPVFKMFMKYFPNAIMAVSYVGEYGLRKYNPGGDGTGWRDVQDGINRYGDAQGRHLLLEARDGYYDERDSGLPHAAQNAWNALARLEILIRSGEVKVRIGNDIKDGKPVLGTAHAV